MYVHTVTVETYRGTNGYGEDMFADPVEVRGYIEGSDKLIRTSTSEQEVADSVFYTDPGNAALFAVDSRVTAGGAPTRVARCSVFTSGDVDLPDHVVVLLGSPRIR